MKKVELEQKIKELEQKIIALELRPNTIFCPGHACNCHQHYTPPTTSYWPNITYGTSASPWYNVTSGVTTSLELPEDGVNKIYGLK